MLPPPEKYRMLDVTLNRGHFIHPRFEVILKYFLQLSAPVVRIPTCVLLHDCTSNNGAVWGCWGLCAPNSYSQIKTRYKYYSYYNDNNISKLCNSYNDNVLCNWENSKLKFGRAFENSFQCFRVRFYSNSVVRISEECVLRMDC